MIWLLTACLTNNWTASYALDFCLQFIVCLNMNGTVKFFRNESIHFPWIWCALRTVCTVCTNALQAVSLHICLAVRLVSWVQAYLLFKKHGVDGLPAGQDHHGKANGDRHHEAHADHLGHQVGRKVHQHVACDVFCEADVAKETHLVPEEEEARGKDKGAGKTEI